MAIVIIRQDDKIPQWKEALLKVDPDLSIYSYLEDHPREEITMAVVWKHPKGTLQGYPNLKLIASFGAGVDFIFEDQTRPLHVPITRVVDPKLASDMSEFVLGQILSHLKNFNRYKVDQLNKKWQPIAYRRIEDITVGIMGMGALGSVLAKDLLKLNFKVMGWANSPKQEIDISMFVGADEREEFLSKSSVLVCLLPLTEETKGILNKALFSQLPPGAFVINVARGGHLVDEDLLEMLGSGHLSGAYLDVFHAEPLPKDHPFWEHPDIHFTPHIASVSDVPSVSPQIIENYHRLVSDLPLHNQIAIDKGY
ncbi:MAG: 2-hydroxyacid dehydrogenase [Flavobacteriaceae bacterium]